MQQDSIVHIPILRFWREGTLHAEPVTVEDDDEENQVTDESDRDFYDEQGISHHTV